MSCGLPGAGKTTLARRHFALALTDRMHAATARNLAAENRACGRHVIVDAVHWQEAQRARWRDTGHPTLWIAVQCSDEATRQRRIEARHAAGRPQGWSPPASATWRGPASSSTPRATAPTRPSRSCSPGLRRSDADTRNGVQKTLARPNGVA